MHLKAEKTDMANSNTSLRKVYDVRKLQLTPVTSKVCRLISENDRRRSTLSWSKYDWPWKFVDKACRCEKEKEVENECESDPGLDDKGHLFSCGQVIAHSHRSLGFDSVILWLLLLRSCHNCFVYNLSRLIIYHSFKHFTVLKPQCFILQEVVHCNNLLTVLVASWGNTAI